MSQPMHPAGWYDDPERAGEKRYWDGNHWTDDHVPAPPAAPPRVPPEPTSAGEEAPQSAAPPEAEAPAEQPLGDRGAEVPPPAAPPGWYDDPDDSGEMRYWDGSGWTDELVPPPPTEPPAVEPLAEAEQPPPEKPSTGHGEPGGAEEVEPSEPEPTAEEAPAVTAAAPSTGHVDQVAAFCAHCGVRPGVPENAREVTLHREGDERVFVVPVCEKCVQAKDRADSVGCASIAVGLVAGIAILVVAAQWLLGIAVFVLGCILAGLAIWRIRAAVGWKPLDTYPEIAELKESGWAVGSAPKGAPTSTVTVARSLNQTMTVHVADETGVRPGGEVWADIQAQPWPDPKLKRIEVELAYKATFLLWHDPADDAVTPIGILSGGWVLEEATLRDSPEYTVVARHAIPVDDIDPTGGVSVKLMIPEEGPPSVGHVVHWAVRVRFDHGRAFERTHHHTAEFRVLGHRGEFGPFGGVGWAHHDTAEFRVLGHRQDQLLQALSVHQMDEKRSDSTADRLQDVQLAISTTAVAPGEVIEGTVSVRPDPARFAQHHGRHWTKGGTEAMLDRVSDAPQHLDVQAVRVRLECWRGRAGGYAFPTTHRILEVSAEIAGPHSMAVGEMRNYPFRVSVPRTATLSLNEDSSIAGPVPATFFGSHVEGATLDDFRWRVLGEVVAPPGQFKHRIGLQHGEYPGEFPTSPLWATEEVIVADR